MKNFVVSVVASIVASLFCFLFSAIVSSTALSLIMSVVGLLTLIAVIFVVHSRKKSKNPYLKVDIRNREIGLMPNCEKVTCKGVSILFPNYIIYLRKDGSKGRIHYSQVVIYM